MNFCLYMVNIYCVSVIWYQETVLLKSLKCDEESKYKKNANNYKCIQFF